MESDSDTILCRICERVIPPERLAILPDTRICVECSRRVGGEYELKVTVGGTGKPGSLKITGQEITARRQRKRNM